MILRGYDETSGRRPGRCGDLMVHGGCNSLMNYPQTHQFEGKEETGQRRKAIFGTYPGRIRLEEKILGIALGDVTIVPTNSRGAGRFLAETGNAFKARATRMSGLLRRTNESGQRTEVCCAPPRKGWRQHSKRSSRARGCWLRATEAKKLNAETRKTCYSAMR
jgi:hypothetical protein